MLDTERLYEGGPIPWSKVEDYCQRYGLDDRQTETMHTLVRVMDNEVSADRAKRSGKGSDGEDAPTTRPRHGRVGRNHTAKAR